MAKKRRKKHRKSLNERISPLLSIPSGTIKILHWNTQLMPSLFSEGRFEPGELFYYPHKEKIEKLVNAIFNTDPDIIFLNEVFHEQSRSELFHILSSRYKSIIPNFGPILLSELLLLKGKIEDSGLMFFSKYQINSVFFESFENLVDDDNLANKGYGIIELSLGRPIGSLAVVLTHMQADYSHEGENERVRADNIRQILAAINAKYLSSTGKWRIPVIVSGDLNIVGNNAGGRPEWVGLFPPSGLGGQLFDQWDINMPFEDGGATIQGSRKDNGTTERPQRLDYLLINRAVELNLVAQHMRVTHKGISDHHAVQSHIGIEASNCCPNSAIIAASGASRSRVHYLHPGTLQWIKFERSGTYVFGKDANSHIHLYAAENISSPLPDFNRTEVDVGLIPGAQPVFEGLPPIARKFATHNAPFFVLAESKNKDSAPGADGVVAWWRCQGQNPYDAIVLHSHLEEKFDWPIGKKINSQDEAWFVLYFEKLSDGSQHSGTLHIKNPTGRVINVTVYERDLGVYERSAPNQDFECRVNIRSSGGQVFYIGVQRSDVSQRDISLTWRSDLTFLSGVKDGDQTKIGLYCFDETGPDWAGSDEIVLDIFSGHRNLRHCPSDAVYWGADTGSRILFPIEPVAFTGSIGVRITELEDLVSDQSNAFNIYCLSEHDPGDNPNSPHLLRTQDVKLGYEFCYLLLRFLPGGSSTGVP